MVWPLVWPTSHGPRQVTPRCGLRCPRPPGGSSQAACAQRGGSEGAAACTPGAKVTVCPESKGKASTRPPRGRLQRASDHQAMVLASEACLYLKIFSTQAMVWVTRQGGGGHHKKAGGTCLGAVLLGTAPSGAPFLPPRRLWASLVGGTHSPVATSPDHLVPLCSASRCPTGTSLLLCSPAETSALSTWHSPPPGSPPPCPLRTQAPGR